jgi:transcriptional regulator with XRE-family HTH domain
MMTNPNKKQSEKDEFLKKFGLHIRKLRKERGLSGVELANLCELPRSNISRIEKGRTNPTVYFLKKLSEALEIDVEVILVGLNRQEENV